jgi:hypothetical protein
MLVSLIFKIWTFWFELRFWHTHLHQLSEIADLRQSVFNQSPINSRTQVRSFLFLIFLVFSNLKGTCQIDSLLRFSYLIVRYVVVACGWHFKLLRKVCVMILVARLSLKSCVQERVRLKISKTCNLQSTCWATDCERSAEKKLCCLE